MWVILILGSIVLHFDVFLDSLFSLRRVFTVFNRSVFFRPPLRLVPSFCFVFGFFLFISFLGSVSWTWQVRRLNHQWRQLVESFYNVDIQFIFKFNNHSGILK